MSWPSGFLLDGVGLTDLVEPPLEREHVKALHRQCSEDRNAVVEHPKRICEGEMFLDLGSFGGCGIWLAQWAVIGWPGQ